MSKEEDAKLATSNSLPAASLPRVLVLSEDIPQTRNAGGIVLWRLFAGYGEGEKLKGVAAAKLFVIGPKAHLDAELLDCPYRELRMPLRRLETSRFSTWKRSLQALGLIPLPSDRKILRLLGDFRPDVVVSVMQNTPWILTVERMARRLGIPFVLIVHDVNEEFEKVFPWAEHALFKVNRRVYRSAARRLCVSPEMAKFLEERYGVRGDVMYPIRSEELQPRPLEMLLSLRAAADQETKRRKDKRGEGDRKQATVGSEHTADGQRHTENAPTADSPPATSNPLQASAPLTLGYAGSLAYGYGEALVDLIPVLRETGARILISTPRPPEKLKVLLEAIDVVEWLPHRADINEMWRTMQERVDVMILPYANPAGSHELLYRTHFPSKLTEYLALGMPVIVSGPEFATGVRWAQAEKLKSGKAEMLKISLQEFQTFSVCRRAVSAFGSGSEFLDFAPNGAVPCTTREELAACLSRLKQDEELRRALAQIAVDAGQRDFDPKKVRTTFVKALCGAAGDRARINPSAEGTFI